MRERQLPSPGMGLVWVAMGALPGALLRWMFADVLVANTLGCFIVGAAGLLGSTSARRRQLVGVGFAGSLTTFSSWIVQLLTLLENGQWFALVSQLVRDGSLGIAALLLGAALHHWLRERRALRRGTIRR